MPFPPANAAFGIPYGEKLAPTGSPAQLVDGLTTCRFVLVKPLSTNLGDVIVTSRDGTGSGFRLKAADAAVKLDLRYDNTSLLFTASANGASLTYIGVGSVGE